MFTSTCEKQGSDSKSVNRWRVEEVEFINISFLLPYKLAKSYMEDIYNKTIKLMREFIESSMRFPIIVETGNNIRDRIEEVLK